MDASPPRAESDEALTQVDAQLREDPGALAHLFARAQLLNHLGRDEEARRAYVELVQREPTHREGLTALAMLLKKTGHVRAAVTALLQVVTAHPGSTSAHANYAMALAESDNLALARQHYETAIELDADNRHAHRGIAIVLLLLGEARAAEVHATKAGSSVDVWPFRGEGAPVSLLLLWSARGNNIAIDPFLDDRVFQKTTLAVELWNPCVALPPHDIVFNGIGDADACQDALRIAVEILRGTTKRVINPPDRVSTAGRAMNAARLPLIPGVMMAKTELWSRRNLEAADAACLLARAGFVFPLLIRSPGFHAGANFEKVDSREDLPRVLAEVPGEDIFVLEYVDTRGDDGKFRKYRVMMIDGRLYPLHLAVSARWKIHFFSADMSTSAEHRALDEAFLFDMRGVMGLQVMSRLEQIRDTMALDYGGIDFAIDGQGRVVVFETNATMSILAPPKDAIWEYRRAPVERVGDAVRAMLLGKTPPNGESK